jgi:glycine/D-amino acid oxidase-like deaminating enzyme
MSVTLSFSMLQLGIFVLMLAGVQVVENCAVQQIMSRNGKVVAVDTSTGMVECQYFVNCGGFWARKIGKLSEPYVKVPLHACEHYYLHTKPIPGLDPMTPGTYVWTDVHWYFILDWHGASQNVSSGVLLLSTHICSVEYRLLLKQFLCTYKFFFCS